MARTIGWLLGGTLVASGVINLLWSFGLSFGGQQGTDIALSLDRVGFDAIGNLGTYPSFLYSVFAIGVGLPTLVGLNATQWKNTGGY